MPRFLNGTLSSQSIVLACSMLLVASLMRRVVIPSTRLLHWASHGIPVIAWWFYAYMELSANERYQLGRSKQVWQFNVRHNPGPTPCQQLHTHDAVSASIVFIYTRMYSLALHISPSSRTQLGLIKVRLGCATPSCWSEVTLTTYGCQLVITVATSLWSWNDAIASTSCTIINHRIEGIQHKG
eukprot:1910961-Amphidinium_carterae.1